MTDDREQQRDARGARLSFLLLRRLLRRLHVPGLSRAKQSQRKKNEFFFNFFCHTFLFPQSPRGPSFQPPFPASKVRLARPRIPPIHHIAGKHMLLYGSASTREGRRRKKAFARARHRPTVSLSKQFEREQRKSIGSLEALDGAPPPCRSQLPLLLLSVAANELYNVNSIHSGGVKSEDVAATPLTRTSA